MRTFNSVCALVCLLSAVVVYHEILHVGWTGWLPFMFAWDVLFGILNLLLAQRNDNGARRY